MTIDGIRTIQREADTTATDDSHRDTWLVFLFSGGLRRCLYLPGSGFCIGEGQRHFPEYAAGLLGRDSFEVFLAWHHEQTCHVEGSRTHHELLVAFSEIAVGTMLPAGQDGGDELVMVVPEQDVHHRLTVLLTQGKGSDDLPGQSQIAFL